MLLQWERVQCEVKSALTCAEVLGILKGVWGSREGEQYGLEQVTERGIYEEQKEGLVDRTRPSDLVSQPLPRGEMDLSYLYRRRRWCWWESGPSEAGPSPPTGIGSKIRVVSLHVCLQKRHWCIEQSYGLCGRGRGWEDLGEWQWNM